MSEPYGTSGYANINDLVTVNEMTSFCNSWHFLFRWEDLETSPDVWDYTDFDADIATVVNAGLKVSFMVFTGDYAPSWLYSAPYSVPLVQTTTANYPYYFNPSTFDSSGTYAYKTRWYNMLDQVRAHVATLQEYQDGNLLFWQSAEGKTGDEPPYGGTIVDVTINGVSVADPTLYDIDLIPDWNDWKHDAWATQVADIAADIPLIKLMINPANNGQNWLYKETTYPTNVYIKSGDFSHNYSFPGESYYADFVQGQNELGMMVRGEIDTPPLGDAWWDAQPNQNTMALCACALNAGMNFFNVATSAYLVNATANDAYDFYTEFARVNSVAQTTGFIYFRDVLDFADTDRFPTGTYGSVINPADQATYDALVAIVNADPVKPAAVKLYNITFLTIRYYNPTRITNIQADFPTALFDVVENRDGDQYSNDFGCDTWPGSWSSGITIYDQYNTTIPRWRYAADPYFIGRYGLMPDTEMFMTVDFATNQRYAAVLKVTYYDGAVGVADVNYWNGTTKVAAGTITTGNSSEIMTVTYNISSFYGGGNLANSTDISLENISGNSIIFGLLTISLTSNAMAFTPNFSTSQSIGLPNEIIITDTSTGSDVAITSRRVYILNYLNEYLVESGTSTNYEVWAYADSSITLDILTQDTATAITVQWLDINNVVLYTKTSNVVFTLYDEQFLYDLAANESQQLTLLQDTEYLMNTFRLRIFVDNANNSVEIGNNIYTAQTNLNQGQKLIDNESLFF